MIPLSTPSLKMSGSSPLADLPHFLQSFSTNISPSSLGLLDIMCFKFGLLCHLLNELERIREKSGLSASKAVDLDTQAIHSWFNDHDLIIPRQSPEAVAFLSCLSLSRAQDRSCLRAPRKTSGNNHQAGARSRYDSVKGATIEVNSFITAPCPCWAAHDSGVRLSTSLASGSAPFSSSSFTTAPCPCWAAHDSDAYGRGGDTKTFGHSWKSNLKRGITPDTFQPKRERIGCWKRRMRWEL